MTTKKANRINVKNIVYAILEKDDSSGVTYKDIKPFGKAMQIQLTPTLATGVLYGDGVKQESISKLTGITAVVDVNKIFIDVRAEIQGNKFENGVLIESADDEPPYIALGYEIGQTGKESEYVWLLKGKAQPYGSTVQQTTDNINFGTDSITIEFVPRDYDSEIRKFGDTANSEFTKEMAAVWFDEVGGKALAPPIGP